LEIFDLFVVDKKEFCKLAKDLTRLPPDTEVVVFFEQGVCCVYFLIDFNSLFFYNYFFYLWLMHSDGMFCI